MNGRADTSPSDEAVLGTAARWHARARAGLSDRERAAFLRWLRERPEHAAAADIVARTWDAAPTAASQGGFSAAQEHADSPQRSPAPRRALWGGLVTAGATAAALAFWLAQPQSASFETGPVERRDVVLADGSHLWLAPGTKLAARIGPFARQVTLERGEVVFDVVHQMRGFRVEADKVAVIDQGTLFSVRNRAGRPVTVTLAHGALRIDDRLRGAVLAQPRPGEQVLIRDGLTRVRRVEALDLLAWREGRLVFSDWSLEDALAAFEDQAGTSIHLRDAGLARLRVSGAYATTDIESFLAALSSIHPVRWTRTGHGYEIGRR